MPASESDERDAPVEGEQGGGDEQTPTPSTRWEYKTIRPPREAAMREADDPESLLNEYGAQGWELTDTITYVEGGTKFLVFKRPQRGGDDA